MTRNQKNIEPSVEIGWYLAGQRPYAQIGLNTLRDHRDRVKRVRLKSRELAIGLKATGSTAAPSSNHASAGALVTWKTPTQTRRRSFGAALGCSTTSITEPFGNLWATHTGIAVFHYHKTRFIVVPIRKIIDRGSRTQAASLLNKPNAVNSFISPY